MKHYYYLGMIYNPEGPLNKSFVIYYHDPSVDYNSVPWSKVPVGDLEKYKLEPITKPFKNIIVYEKDRTEYDAWEVFLVDTPMEGYVRFLHNGIFTPALQDAKLFRGKNGLTDTGKLYFIDGKEIKEEEEKNVRLLPNMVIFPGTDYAIRFLEDEKKEELYRIKSDGSIKFLSKHDRINKRYGLLRGETEYYVAEDGKGPLRKGLYKVEDDKVYKLIDKVYDIDIETFVKRRISNIVIKETPFSETIYKITGEGETLRLEKIVRTRFFEPER